MMSLDSIPSSITVSTYPDYISKLQEKHLPKKSASHSEDTKHVTETERFDFFIIESFDAFKGDMGCLELPLFSLRTKDLKDSSWKSQDGNTNLFIKPNSSGRATIFDFDILIYAISALVHSKNKGLSISKTITFATADFFKATLRSRGGNSYISFKGALDRLVGTTYETNFNQGNFTVDSGFNLISSYRSIKLSKSGHILEVQITLCDWIYQAILVERPLVKTINPKYFELRKAIEKRIYHIALKKVGRQKEWGISIDGLQKRIGSAQASKAHFLMELKRCIRDDSIPDYRIRINGDKVVFSSRDPNKIL